MKTLIAGLLGAGLTLSAAAEDTSRNSELVTSVDQATLQFIAESMDHPVQGDLPGDIGVIASQDGLTYALQGKACGDDGACQGLEIFIAFDGTFTVQAANEINQRWSAIKATQNEGDLLLTRYLILDDGQTIGNIRTNLLNALAIANVFNSEQTNTVSRPINDLVFGDDSGPYANDGACDDARFSDEGDIWDYQREHVLRDATDCQAKFEQGEIALLVDFGDNSGEYADDQTCDDNRFTGEGRSILITDSHIKKDAADCITAYRAGTIDRP